MTVLRSVIVCVVGDAVVWVIVTVDFPPVEAAGQVEVPALVTVTVEAEPAERVTVDAEAMGQVDAEVLIIVTVDALAEPKDEAVRVTVEAAPVAHVAADLETVIVDAETAGQEAAGIEAAVAVTVTVDGVAEMSVVT